MPRGPVPDNQQLLKLRCWPLLRYFRIANSFVMNTVPPPTILVYGFSDLCRLCRGLLSDRYRLTNVHEL